MTSGRVSKEGAEHTNRPTCESQPLTAGRDGEAEATGPPDRAGVR